MCQCVRTAVLNAFGSNMPFVTLTSLINNKCFDKIIATVRIAVDECSRLRRRRRQQSTSFDDIDFPSATPHLLSSLIYHHFVHCIENVLSHIAYFRCDLDRQRRWWICLFAAVKRQRRQCTHTKAPISICGWSISIRTN